MGGWPWTPRDDPKGGRFRVLVVGAHAGGFGLLRARKRTSSGLSAKTAPDPKWSPSGHSKQLCFACRPNDSCARSDCSRPDDGRPTVKAEFRKVEGSHG